MESGHGFAEQAERSPLAITREFHAGLCQRGTTDNGSYVSAGCPF
jgi:hypothetical protein